MSKIKPEVGSGTISRLNVAMLAPPAPSKTPSANVPGSRNWSSFGSNVYGAKLKPAKTPLTPSETKLTISVDWEEILTGHLFAFNQFYLNFFQWLIPSIQPDAKHRYERYGVGDCDLIASIALLKLVCCEYASGSVAANAASRIKCTMSANRPALGF